jgi:hypothetical protein
MKGVSERRPHGSRRWVRGVWAAAAVGMAATILAPGVSRAQTSDETVMTGLNNPRGLTFTRTGKKHARDDGRRRWALYVAEAGTGGTLRCAPVRGTVCVGLTGSVSRYARGRQERIVEGLPSYAPFATGASAGAVGPQDVSFAGRRGYVAIGLAAPLAIRPQLGENFGWMARFRPNGKVSYDVDVSAYEAQANPDQGHVESNPYGLLKGAGARVVADAAGNTLLRLNSAGRISTRAVFSSRPQGRETAPPPPSPPPPPDGALYVGELTGAPFAPGRSAIWRVAPGQAPQAYCTGFSYIIDMDFDRRGRLYVLEHASGPGGPFQGTPGQLLRIGPGCQRTPVRTGIPAPMSVVIGPGGDAFVSINGTAPGTGSVIRVGS